MKKNVVAIVIFLSLFLVGLANATTYGGIEFPQEIKSFADEVVSYTPGSGVASPYNNSTKALSKPDDNFVSLGDEGILILKFTDNSLTTSGNSKEDLWIFEFGVSKDPNAKNEPTSVYISINGIDWISVGNAAGGKYGIDIDQYTNSGVVPWEKYTYVKLVDLLPSLNNPPYCGADIDAVGAISTPIPAAVWLLGSGLIGIAAFRKRFSS